MLKKPVPSIRIPSARAEDRPATRKHLELVRRELRSEIRALDARTEAGFHKIQGEMQALRSELGGEMQALRSELGGEIQAVRSELNGLRVEFGTFRSVLEEIRASVSGMAINFEQQREDNRFVMEGYQLLWQRQERIEHLLSESSGNKR
jgi:chromosome segregation ATPase